MDEYMMVLVIVGIVILGGLVVGAVAKNKEGATEGSKSVAVGVYDIIAGLMMLFYSVSELERYLSSDEEMMYTYLKYAGILWIVLGFIQFVIPLFVNSMSQIMDEKVDEKIREQRRSERRAKEKSEESDRLRKAMENGERLIPVWRSEERLGRNGQWKCSACGEENDASDSCCKRCGMYR